MCRPLHEGIIAQRSTVLSEKIYRTNSAGAGLRTFCILALLVATPRGVESAGVDPCVPVRRAYSWPPGFGPAGSSESVYLGYGGDPWGTSSATTHAAKERHARFSWQTQSAPASRNVSNKTETELNSEAENNSSRLRRSKRGVVHLYNMVFCATGCNPLAYKGYGCYCGFLGSGFSIDGIDRCCKMHDWCYEATDCPMFLEYFVPYYWKCYRGYKPICAVEHGEWGGSGSCAQRLCECDRALAECLRRYPCPTTKAMCTSSAWRLVQNLFMVM
ncbi:uncharacterized protein LOC124310436 [Neodiprion virginianus]|uniref:uncharacterized protein LOC124310436 n=1 Tax=Neodiprion virginianus TaxID=2961670 RepID=UPI001EE73D1E|nr:uncharacterized protein LOC124310436 [Neodiprion virginianus]